MRLSMGREKQGPLIDRLMADGILRQALKTCHGTPMSKYEHHSVTLEAPLTTC